jgi:hypothetical protein
MYSTEDAIKLGRWLSVPEHLNRFTGGFRMGPADFANQVLEVPQSSGSLFFWAVAIGEVMTALSIKLSHEDFGAYRHQDPNSKATAWFRLVYQTMLLSSSTSSLEDFL